ncbi:hypothetical protein V1273_000472 [Bradyrhizobium sp. AZCC 1721]
MGRFVPKRDSFSRLRCAMLDIDRSEEILDGEFVNLDEPVCVELVPVAQSVHWSQRGAMPRPDPTFLAQLIATADQTPQTRGLRRASLADAQTAYGASQIRCSSTGFRTRQSI